MSLQIDLEDKSCEEAATNWLLTQFTNKVQLDGYPVPMLTYALYSVIQADHQFEWFTQQLTNAYAAGYNAGRLDSAGQPPGDVTQSG